MIGLVELALDGVTPILRDPAVERLFGVDQPLELDALDQAVAGYNIYDPVTRIPMEYCQLPNFRALQEGAAGPTTLLVIPPGQPERYVCVRSEVILDAAGEPLLLRSTYSDVTEEWVATGGLNAVDVDYAVMLCPCDQWQLEVPLHIPSAWIEETLREHMDECIVLAASRLTSLAAQA